MVRDQLEKSLGEFWKRVRDIEPAPGKVTAAQMAELRSELDALTAQLATLEESPAATGDPAESASPAQLRQAAAVVLARAAAVAHAADEPADVERWLAKAEAFADDDDRPVIAAARKAPERYRALVHGRYLMAHQRDGEARKLWTSLAKDQADALASAAEAEILAPRPLRPGDSPTLWRINGCGFGFYGRRDTWRDGSYATTHCISIAFLPVFALSAWRVRDARGGYHILAREQLSPFARTGRWAMLAAIGVAIAIASISSYAGDPQRLAAARWDAALAAAETAEPDAALHQLDAEVAQDAALIDAPRAERTGAKIVRLTASYIGTPFTVDKVDQAIRVIRRYQSLPDKLRGGAAEAELVQLVERWADQLGNSAGGEPRLVLLRQAYDAVTGPSRGPFGAEIDQAQLALAEAKRTDEPVTALGYLVDGSSLTFAELAIADKIAAQLAEAPSLLVDAGDDIDHWLAATHAADLKKRITQLRFDASKGRDGALADGVTPAQLAQMATARPWDQFVQLQLARNDASASDLTAATARLAKLGTPGMTIRAARLFAAQLAAAQNKLEAADAQLAALLGPRVIRFTAASQALRDALKAGEDRLDAILRAGNVPPDVQAQLTTAANDDARREIIQQWGDGVMKADSAISEARTRYQALGDIVPISLAAGSVKLRRAQALTGPARDRMLGDAERTFLAIRTEAEGEPAFKLGLGEIYARLGKTAESEAAFADVLAKHDPDLDLAVARTYRSLGSVARAKQVAKQVYDTASSRGKDGAASLLAVMAGDDEEAETWYHKIETSDPSVKASLLQIEARRLERQGKPAECEAKFAEAAKLELSQAHRADSAAYNNAAVSYGQAFDCSADPAALRNAIATLEIAYQQAPEAAIVVRNLFGATQQRGVLTTLSQLIDTRALRLTRDELGSLNGELLRGPERTALVALRAADPSIRRSNELLGQLEVLMPSSAMPYQVAFYDAWYTRDPDRAAAIIAGLRKVSSFDTSEIAEERARRLLPDSDAKLIATSDSTRKRLTALLGSPAGQHLDAKTRAAGWYLVAEAAAVIGLYGSDHSPLAQAREAATTARQLWPALDDDYLIGDALIDEAALAADPATWQPLRHSYGATGALAKLVASHAPLADKIRASSSWAELAASHAKLTPPPTLRDLRLARLLGDAALEAAARPVLDDKLEHLRRELGVLSDPSDEVAAADLAYLDAK